MKISVALCTYNGARFLGQQLESIAAQTRLPDELVVCDDASTDATRATLEAFALTAPFPVEIFANIENVGLVKNFEQAIGKCTGDIIALSDQDDVWLPSKLSRFEDAMIGDPDACLVFSDAIVTAEDLQPTGWKLWDMTFRRPDRKRFAADRELEVLLEYNVVTGAAMAFRSGLRRYALPIPILTDLIHDGWIALVAAARGRVRPIDESLIKYRQHGDQQLGAGLGKWGLPIAERHASFLENRRNALKRLEEIETAFRQRDILNEADISIDDLHRMIEERRLHIQGTISHYEKRAGLPRSRAFRLPAVLREMASGRYHRFSRGFGSAAMDLFSE